MFKKDLRNARNNLVIGSRIWNIGEFSASTGVRLKIKDESGINIADLMMWILIAVLLLAVAIQGLSQYRKSVYVYQMENDLDGVISLAHSNGSSSGTVSEIEIASAVSTSNKSKGVTITWALLSDSVSTPGFPAGTTVSSYMLTAHHAEVPDLDVYYFFNNVGSHNSGLITAPVGSIVPGGGAGGGGGPGGGGGLVVGAPVTCGNGKYTPVGNITITCQQNGPWGGDRVQHLLTLTPTSPVLGHWKVIADLHGFPTMVDTKVSGPSGFPATVDGVDMNNVYFKSFDFTIEGNTNNSPPSSPNNHWEISTAKAPERVLIDINY